MCNESLQMCCNLQPFIKILKTFIKIAQFGVPLLLIVLCSFDLFKAVSKADDDKATKEIKSTIIRRLIYGLIIFLVPYLVQLILTFVDKQIESNDTVNATSWISCWNGTNSNCSSCNDIYKYNNNK